MKIRVSFIEFLNSVPLGWGFLHGRQQGAFQVLFDVPSECARHLATGEVDVGLIPVIEYQRIPGLRILPDIAVASRHEVKSVLFVSRTPLAEIRRVALDTSSRTSAVLLKILLHHYGKTEVEYLEHPPDPEAMLARCEAALLIGNPALRIDRTGLYVFDLAREWHRLTGLPFVFAFWAVRPGIELGSQAEIFYASREEGLQSLDQIASLYSERLGLPEGEIRVYLKDHLDYRLDPPHRQGLLKFFELAESLGLIPQIRPLDFLPVETAAAESMKSFWHRD